MTAFPALFRKELSFFFLTPVAYAVGFFFLLAAGFGLWSLAGNLALEGTDEVLAPLLFGSPSYWLSMGILCPLLTMGLFAEERRRNTLETLMTAPVSETEVVLAKFFAALSAFVVLWLPTLAYGAILSACGIRVVPADWGPIWAGYLGTAVVGAFFLSAGLLCSLLARHQAIAAVASMALLGSLVLAGSPLAHFPLEDARAAFLWLSPWNHVSAFASGVLDWRTLVWYCSSTALALFLSVRFLEARRLR